MFGPVSPGMRGRAVAVALLVACGTSSSSPSGSTSDSGSSACTGGIQSTSAGCTFPWAPGTTLNATFTKVSGSCGNASPETLTIMGAPQPSLGPVCPGACGTVHAEPADAGGCAVTVNVSGCAIAGASQPATMSETATWNASYTMAEGSMTLDIPGGCSSTYTVIVVAQ